MDRLLPEQTDKEDHGLCMLPACISTEVKVWNTKLVGLITTEEAKDISNIFII